MNKITMSKPAFLKEHKELVGILRSRKKAGLKKEAKEQASEVKQKLGVKV